MAITVIDDGTQSTTLNTEHDLVTETGGGIFVLKLDLADLVLTDVLEVRVYDKVLSGGTERLADVVTYQHNQGKPSISTYPFIADIHIRCTVKQTTGTASIPWKLLKIG